MNKQDDGKKPALAATAIPGAAPSANGPEGGQPSGESLDKIRDILFGSQIREQERQTRTLEERLFKSLSDVREDTYKRVSALEDYAKAEFDGLNARAKTEQAERTKGDRDLTAAMAEAQKALDKRLAEMDERTNDALRDLRKSVLDQSKALRDDLQRAQAEINQTIQRVAAELRHEKADRFALADLLQEVALKLKGEFPGHKPR